MEGRKGEDGGRMEGGLESDGGEEGGGWREEWRVGLCQIFRNNF